MKYMTSEYENYMTVISLNRPDKLNAFNSEMMQELAEAVSAAEKNPDTHVIMIQSICEKAFCAGGDLAEEKSLSEENAAIFAKVGQKCLDTIYDCPIPVIAVVHGYALGAAMELMMAVDFTIAADDTVIGMPAVRLASLTAFGGIAMMSRRIGYSRTADLLYTGRNITASEALKLGLVEYIFPRSELKEKARSIGLKMAEYSPSTLCNMKSVLQKSMQLPFEKAREMETKAFAAQYRLPDRQEALEAFFEKRFPKFSSRKRTYS